MTKDDYNLAFDNGEQHFDIARILSNENKFGPAISHLILGIEELIKFLILQQVTVDETLFNEKEINGVFSVHETKYRLIKEFMKSITNDFGQKYLQLQTKEILNKDIGEDLKEIKKNRFKEFGSFLSSSYKELNLSEGELIEFDNWLDKAGTPRNRGFYVDRVNKNCKINDTKLISPNMVTKGNYDLILKFTEPILRYARISKETDLTDNEFINLLNS